MWTRVDTAATEFTLPLPCPTLLAIIIIIIFRLFSPSSDIFFAMGAKVSSRLEKIGTPRGNVVLGRGTRDDQFPLHPPRTLAINISGLAIKVLKAANSSQSSRRHEIKCTPESSRLRVLHQLSAAGPECPNIPPPHSNLNDCGRPH